MSEHVPYIATVDFILIDGILASYPEIAKAFSGCRVDKVNGRIALLIEITLKILQKCLQTCR